MSAFLVDKDISDIIRDKGDGIMDTIITILAIVIGFTILSKMTGFILKLVSIAILLAFLYYMYNGGSLDSIGMVVNHL